MTTNNSSWGATITAHLETAKAEKDSHTNGAYTAFSKTGFAYARFPLRASPKQIREANHLMLQQGYCYLRLRSESTRLNSSHKTVSRMPSSA